MGRLFFLSIISYSNFCKLNTVQTILRLNYVTIHTFATYHCLSLVNDLKINQLNSKHFISKANIANKLESFLIT
jgi:hypothetical protein